MLDGHEVRFLCSSFSRSVLSARDRHRQLDLLLSPPRPSQTLTSSTTQGLVLLSLSSLRSYAYSPQFPSRDTQLLSSFLEDIRALEDLGARAGKEERKVLIGRLRRWGTVLGWEERIKQ